MAVAIPPQEGLAFLAEASALLASSLDYDETLASLAHLVVPRIADWCSIEMIQADGGVRTVAVAHTDPEKVALAVELARRYPFDLSARHGMAHVLRTGKPGPLHRYQMRS